MFVHMGLGWLVFVCLSVIAFAVGKDKALYLGGTRFPSGATLPVRAVEGRIVTGPDPALTFVGGRGSLVIPYTAISSLQYGSDLRLGSGLPRRLLVIPWDPFEQYTKDVHCVLTVAYQDQAGPETVVFELGKDLVRPTLQTLEQRTGKAITFTEVEVCTQYRSADACGYGKPGELKGLTNVHLDADISGTNRALILAEVRKGAPDLAIVPDAPDAQIILRFRSDWAIDPGCPCEGGRGEVVIARGASRRVVLVFTGRKKGIWGEKPAIDFGQTFVAALKRANEGSP
jgi:hypothetical protein